MNMKLSSIGIGLLLLTGCAKQVKPPDVPKTAVDPEPVEFTCAERDCKSFAVPTKKDVPQPPRKEEVCPEGLVLGQWEAEGNGGIHSGGICVKLSKDDAIYQGYTWVN